MYFETINELITMDGHGGYVWFCYGVAVVVISSLFIQPLTAKAKFMRQQRAILKRQQASK